MHRCRVREVSTSRAGRDAKNPSGGVRASKQLERGVPHARQSIAGVSPSTVSPLVDWYLRNRERSRRLFDLIDLRCTTPGRSRCGTRSCSTRGTCRPSASSRFSSAASVTRAWTRGSSSCSRAASIPDSVDAAVPRSGAGDGLAGSRDEVLAFGRAADEAVLDALRDAPFVEDRPGDAARRGASSPRSSTRRCTRRRCSTCGIACRTSTSTSRSISRYELRRRAAGARDRSRIPAGTRTLGADARRIRSAGTTSSAQLRVDVPAFEIDVHNVTNAEFLEFVDAGGYRRARSLVGRGLGVASQAEALEHPIVLGAARRRVAAGTACSRICRSPLAWPVYVSQAEASAFARWRGRRLPTEAEYHRAAFGTPDGRRARVPWGERAAGRDARQLRFRVAGSRFRPASRPAGASAWGVHDLVGNGWEWTSTVFGPFPGFEPMASYPGVLGRVLRRPALRDEGRVAGDGARTGAPQLPQLVPPQLSRTSTRRSERSPRCEPMAVINRSLAAEFAADVRRDLALTPKQLQSKYLYDALGSSLFDAICRLPWYRITARGEPSCSSQHADAIVSALGDDEGTIVELGCGSGEKLVLLAEALQARGGVGARAPDRHLVAGARADRAAARTPAALLGRGPPVDLRGRAAARRRAATGPRADAGPAARIEPRELRSRRRPPRSSSASARALAPGDLLLLGADLVKDEADLLLAYDDPLGVTAAFNRNLLVRINRELGGDFDLSAFAHRAVWNAEQQRIEMHLVSAAPTRRSRFRAPERRCPSTAASGSGPRAPTNTRPNRSSTWARPPTWRRATSGWTRRPVRPDAVHGDLIRPASRQNAGRAANPRAVLLRLSDRFMENRRAAWKVAGGVRNR